MRGGKMKLVLRCCMGMCEYGTLGTDNNTICTTSRQDGQRRPNYEQRAGREME